MLDRNTSVTDHNTVAAFVHRWHNAMVAIANGGGHQSFRLVLASFGERPRPDMAAPWLKLQPALRHISPGDELDDVVSWITDQNRQPGRSVFYSLAIWRHDLPITSTGNATHAIGICGLGADIDRDKQNTFTLDALAMPPTLNTITSTSSDNVTNHNLIWFFDTPSTVEEARKTAKVLCAHVRDTDGTTANPLQMWRVPGTLNWPKSAKVRRGRSMQPMLTRFTGCSTWRSVCPEMLKAALGGVPKILSPTADKPRDRKPPVARDFWDGSQAELDYLESMLRHIDRFLHQARVAGRPILDRRGADLDISKRVPWLRYGRVLHRFFRGADVGLQLWLAMTAGDGQRGFLGHLPCLDEDELRDEWAKMNLDAPNPTGLGTLIEIAVHLGYRMDRKDFGLPQLGADRPSANGLAVRDAARSWQALKSPSADLRYRAARSIARRADAIRLRPTARAVLDLIIDLINAKRGYAWVSHQRLAQMMVKIDGYRWNKNGVRKILLELRDQGFVRMSGADEVGAHGRKGPTYALVPGKGHSWDDDIRWDEEILGQTHGPDVSRIEDIRGQANTWNSDTTTNLNEYEGGTDDRGVVVAPLPQQPSKARREEVEWLLGCPFLPALFEPTIEAALKAPRRTAMLGQLSCKLQECQAAGLEPTDIAAEIERSATWALQRKKSDDNPYPPPKVVSAMVDVVIELLGDQPANAAALASLRLRQQRQRDFGRTQRSRPASLISLLQSNSDRGAKDGEL